MIHWISNTNDIDQKDAKGEYHGYQQWYWDNDLWVRCTYKHGNDIGYEENHRNEETNYYII
jgi:hypothetical protein